MKKILAVVMVVIMAFALVACGGKTETATGDKTTENTATTTEKASNAEDTENNESKPAEEPAVPETWEKSFYVDEFDEPTDEWFVSTSFSGTFSNSATNDSALTGYVLIDAENVSFLLYEYNRNQVKNIYSRDKAYTIMAKLEDGSQAEYKGSVWSEGDRVVVSNADKPRILELLKNSGKIKFYIYETENSVTNYLFSVESNNLKDLLP